MHVDFDPLQVQWSALAEADGPIGVQFGGYSVFRGVPYQRGAGLAQVFRHVWRYLLPIGKEIGSAIGRQGLESGSKVLNNVLEGRDLRESLASEGRAGLRNLLDKAAKRLDTQSGKGFDFRRYRNNADGGNSMTRMRTGKVGRQRGSIRLGKTIHKLASNVGPPNFLPNPLGDSITNQSHRRHKKRKSTPHSSSGKGKKRTKNKRPRFDTLGTY